MGELDHPIRKNADIAGFTLRNQILLYSAFENTINEIRMLHYRFLKSRVSEGLLIYGQQGSGKSTSVKYYAKHFPRNRVDGVIRMPVLTVITPESPTVKSLSDVILAALGDPLTTNSTAAKKAERIKYFFKVCQVEMLILDEFHHFHDSRRSKSSGEVSDWLKNLMNTTGVCIVLVGLPRAISALNANGQFRRRFASPLHHKEFNFTTREEQIEFRTVLKGIERLLPVKFEKPLETGEIAMRMYFASHGLIDYVVKIIDDAVATSGAKTGEKISIDRLRVAFKRKVWADCPDWLNPIVSTVPRRLTKPREPFCDWDDPTKYTLSDRSVAGPQITEEGKSVGGVQS
jgi:hypothetical protein